MDYMDARQNMVDGQLRPNRIVDMAVLERFMTIPRELFVPPAARETAYADTVLHVDDTRFLLPPLVVARLLQSLDVQLNHNALVVGSGTGYTAALLAGLVQKEVYALEDNRALCQQARNTLLDVHSYNVKVVEGPLPQGYAAGAPYDIIWLNGPVMQVPQALLAQLAPCGRLVAIVMNDRGMGEAMLFTKQGKTVLTEVLFETGLLPILPQFEQAEEFEF